MGKVDNEFFRARSVGLIMICDVISCAVYDCFLLQSRGSSVIQKIMCATQLMVVGIENSAGPTFKLEKSGNPGYLQGLAVQTSQAAPVHWRLQKRTNKLSVIISEVWRAV
jgi:S-adenosylmethionine synthetase